MMKSINIKHALSLVIAENRDPLGYVLEWHGERFEFPLNLSELAADVYSVPALKIPVIPSELIDSKKGEELILNRARAIAYHAFLDVVSSARIRAAESKTDEKRKAGIHDLAVWAYTLRYMQEFVELQNFVEDSKPLAHAYDENMARIFAAYMHTACASADADIPRFFPERTKLTDAFLGKPSGNETFTDWFKPSEKAPKKADVLKSLHRAIVSPWESGCICNPLVQLKNDAKAIAFFESVAIRGLRRADGTVKRTVTAEKAFIDFVNLYVVKAVQDGKCDAKRMKTAEKADKNPPESAIETSVETPTETPTETM